MTPAVEILPPTENLCTGKGTDLQAGLIIEKTGIFAVVTQWQRGEGGLGGGCAGQFMEIVHWAEPGWVPRTAQGRQNLSLWGDEPRPGMQKKILECWCRGVETIAVPGVRAGSRHTLFASSALWSLISPRASFSEHSQAEDLAQHLMEVASPP